jgi:Zn-dependent peptidase ImmA (M78 family)/DNA-binding XRE family transcriptional regulator
MTVTQQELGRRIRTARETNRMTQDEVASRLGLSRSAVVQIEAGNRSVSSLELDRLAYLFGRDIREFVAASFEEEDTLGALFRAQPDVADQPEVVEKLRECMALGRELTNLERLVGIDRDIITLATYSLPMPRSRWEAIQQGDRLADAERRRLGLGVAPLSDVAELLETQGIRTAIVDLPEDVSGLTLSDRSVGIFVVANRVHHHVRRRFSFAHEYAHVVADRARFGVVSRASERDDLVEVRANSFAASFLMPEEGVRNFVATLGKGKPSRSYAELFDEGGALSVEGRAEPGSQTVQLYDVVQMAHHFGVSRISALYRLRNLRLVTAKELDRLKALDESGKGRQIANLLGLPEPDHEAVRNEFRHRFLGLALEAYRRDEISRGKLEELAAMVALAPADLDRLVEDTGLDDDDTAPTHAR